MTWSQVRANWHPLHEQVHQRWDLLTGDEITAIRGQRHKLVATIRSRYAVDEAEATSQADAFVSALQVLSL